MRLVRDMICISLALMVAGCSMHRTTMTGTVDVVDGEWVSIEVVNATDAKTWVKLNRKNMRVLKEGDKVVFYVKVEE